MSLADQQSKMAEGIALLREGVNITEVATRTGVARTTVEAWRDRAFHDACTRCGEKLRTPTAEGLCGWCIEETAEAVPA